jgi:glycosyltransferase involved in cell wall biosynthesis
MGELRYRSSAANRNPQGEASVKISIAMCTCNGAPYVREQLESISSQRRLPDEIVINDDRSSDETVRIIEEWASGAPFPVRLKVNSRRLGSTGNFSAAVARCTGQLIALADQDDVWLEHKLDEAERAFAGNRNLGLWFTDAELVDDKLEPLGRTLWQSIGFNHRWQRRLQGDHAFAALLKRSFVTGATLVFDARLKDLVLPIPDDLRYFIHDRWIATLAAAVAAMRFSGRPSMLYRQHARQQVGTAPSTTGFRRIARRFVRHGPATLDDLTNLRAVADRLGDRGKYVPAPAAGEDIAERMGLLQMRASLPPGRLRRLAPVAKALFGGAYSRHAEGIASAAKDALL